jgi:hypothetical protein
MEPNWTHLFTVCKVLTKLYIVHPSFTQKRLYTLFVSLIALFQISFWLYFSEQLPTNESFNYPHNTRAMSSYLQ